MKSKPKPFKGVKMWAVINKRGDLAYHETRPMIYASKIGAQFNAFEEHLVIPILITPLKKKKR